jgi:hypothetical protein
MVVMGGTAGKFSETPEPRDFPDLVSKWGEFVPGSWNPWCFQVLAGGWRRILDEQDVSVEMSRRCLG